MLRRLISLVCFIFALAVGPGFAQSSGSVLTIDTEAIYETSVPGREIEKALGLRRAALVAENQDIEQALIQEEQDIADRRESMTNADFRALADAFDEKVQTIRDDQEEKLRRLTEGREATIQQFFQDVLPIVTQVVSERGGSVVIERRNVFLSADSTDITAEVIARLDQAFEDGALTLTLPETEE